MHLVVCWFIALLLYACTATAQWDPNAGVVPSYTDGAVIEVSSAGIGNPALAIDGDDQTYWLTTNPLPANYFSRSDQNILLHRANNWFASSGLTNASAITDADINTYASISLSGNRAWLSVVFPQAQPLIWCHLKVWLPTANDSLKLFAYSSATDSTLLGTLTSADNYALRGFALSGVYTHLRLWCQNTFRVFEWAAMADNPREWIVLDLGQQREVGYVRTRHWAGSGNAVQTRLYLSQDNQNWTQVATLDPEALYLIPTQVDPPQQARYIKLEHELVAENYRKAFVWEIDAWDRYGPYGPRPAAAPSTVTFAQMLGVNGIWGWGHNTYSANLGPGEGPDLYNDFATSARNYHNWSWDVTDPDIVPDYANMAAGNGTQAQPWLNWDIEYGAWQVAGLQTGCTIQFRYWNPAVFDNPYQAAYQYGLAFAQHFGPTAGNGLVHWIEVGNEPWSYDAATYRLILRGMAQGVAQGDANLFVLPCALQAWNPAAELTPTAKNYIGARITPQEAPLLDALNAHAYSFTRTADGTRVAVHPEHYDSGMRQLYNLLRWRDANMPGIPVWLTEWGWDHDGGGESCTHSECVNEVTATAWFTRALMQFWRLGIPRALVYFFSNTTDPSSLFTRSGVTGSALTNFQKKGTFRALESLTHLIGDRYFLGVLREDDTAWIYQLGDADGTVTHIVAWRPVDAVQSGTVPVDVTLPAAPEHAWLIDGQNSVGTPIALPVWQSGTTTLLLSPIPQVVALTTATSPVELSAFEAFCESEKVELRWTTRSEVNAAHFELWESADGRQWMLVDTLQAAGCSVTTYTYQLAVPIAAGPYFRLRSVDLDGSSSWSSVVQKSCSPLLMLKAWPNPTSMRFTYAVYVASTQEAVVLSLVDTYGVMRWQHVFWPTSTGWLLPTSVDVSYLPGGNYILQARQGIREASAKILILMNEH